MQTRCVHSNFEDQKLKVITESWLTAFLKEACIFENADQYEEFWRDYKERPLISMLANGVARSDKTENISLLCEYPVYENKRFAGRCDLWIKYIKEQWQFFVEAKYITGTFQTGFLSWAEDESEKLMMLVKEQLYKYHKPMDQAENASYSINLIFHTVDFLTDTLFNEYLEKAKNHALGPNMFYCSATSDDPKASVYKKYNILEVFGFLY
jgi:hypothetical protein